MPDSFGETRMLRLRAAVDSAPSGLLMTDAEGRIVLVNREIERLFGYDREELLGRPVELLVPERFVGHHPSDRDTFLHKPSVRPMGAGRDLYGRHKDGSEVPVEIGLTPVATVEGLFVVASVVDISARRQAEEERARLQAQLQESQRAGVIGTLASGVAHDFNNLLGAIVGYAELARARAGDPGTVRDLDALLAATSHGRRIVDRILRFGRRAHHEAKVQDLGATVEEAAHLMRATLPSTIEIELSIPGEPLRVLADATSIHQVLMNLATNAAQAMPSGGRLHISLEAVYLRDSAARALPNLHEGHYILLVVEDTGSGMPPEVLANAFEPFFTTKVPGGGSGLGLSMVRQLVHEHGGAVGLQSAAGAGTIVRCYLPASQLSVASEVAQSEDPPRGAGEHLLYVDDEPMLRDVGRRRLEELGYVVTVAEDGRHALSLVEEQPGRFAVVITDFTMPRMNGLQLAARLHATRPGLPVILVSGVAEHLGGGEAGTPGVVRIVSKPMTLLDLATAVRQVLAPA